MKTKRNSNHSLLAASALALVLGLAAAQAHSAIISLTPGGANWTTNDNSNLNGAAVASLVGTSSVLRLLYKMNVGGAEDGTFAGSYSTVFANTSSDPQDATITYDGSPDLFITCPNCYLVVKDGNQNPAQYLFDIGTWNGMDTFSLTGFWPQQGAISNVAIWGASTNGGTPPLSIPEPGALLLMGAGLMGLGLVRRRKSR